MYIYKIILKMNCVIRFGFAKFSQYWLKSLHLTILCHAYVSKMREIISIKMLVEFYLIPDVSFWWQFLVDHISTIFRTYVNIVYCYIKYVIGDETYSIVLHCLRCKTKCIYLIDH